MVYLCIYDDELRRVQLSGQLLELKGEASSVWITV